MCNIIFNIMPSSIMLVAVVGSSSDTIFFFLMLTHWKKQWRQMPCESDHSNTSVVKMALRAPKIVSGE